MNCFFLFVAVCSILVQADHIQEETVENVEGEPRIPSTDDIKAMIEKLRLDLVKKGYNDIKLNDYELPIDSEALGIDVNIKTSGAIRGLVGFKVTKFSGLLNYNYDVVWPEIDVLFEPYDLKGYVHMIQVFGTGKLHANIKELGISGKIGLFPDPGFPPTSVFIKSINIKVRLDKEQDEKWFSLTGWLNDPDRSDVISALVRENLQPMLVEYEKEISAFLAKTIMELVKDVHIPI